MLKYFQIGGLLLGEAVTKPSWAYHHLLGFIDERILLRFHQGRRGENRKYARSLDAICKEISTWKPHASSDLSNTSSSWAKVDIASVVISAKNDASQELQRLVSALTSELKPKVVVEVGVGRGATTRTILQSMRDNGCGHLYSIEFPSLRWNYACEVGALVPNDLRDRWTLVWGPSQLRLPELFRKLGPVGLFIHDGAHSYHIQKMDFTNAARNLAPGGVFVSDDITNDSFLEVAEKHHLNPFMIEQSKGNPIGVAFNTRPSARS